MHKHEMAICSLPYFLDPSAENPHEAVGVAVVVNGGHGTLRPAHQNEVKITISLNNIYLKKYLDYIDKDEILKGRKRDI